MDERNVAMGHRFADAITRSEETGDVEPVVALFDEGAELHSLVHEQPVRGIDAVRKFWQEYLASFRDLHSRFERVSDYGGFSVLEWVTEGTLASGARITYRGVSLVEHDGDRVHAFRTYYDTNRLSGRHAEERERASVAG